MTKKFLSLLLALCLLVGGLPTAAFAEEAPWAADAVDTLNGIYGSGVFSASMETMTEGDAYAVLSGMGCSAEGITQGSSENLTRSKACEVLATIFKLPVGEKSAIVYLHEQNIVNGTGVDENGQAILAESGTITKAEFAVLAYRILNTVGGGLGSSVETLKPGTDEYFVWMYLAARACVYFDVGSEILNQKISVASATDIVPKFSENSNETIWDVWYSKLNALHSFSKPEVVGENVTVLQAAMNMVNAYIEAGGSATIFSDVSMDGENGWCYDGVMYLFDRGIVTGYGNGRFGPADSITRAQLALILTRLDGKEPTEAEKATQIPDSAPEWATDEAKAAVARGYIALPEETSDGWWNDTITREDAVAGCIRMCANVYNISLDEDNINTAILNHFSDVNDISEYANPCMAYAVSHGIINGTAEGKIAPKQGSSRGEMGVLLYRALVGLDVSKMKDYEDNVSYALPSAAEEVEGA